MRIFMFVTAFMALLHVYFFWRLRSAFGPGKWQWGAIVFFSCMVVLFYARRSVIGTIWEDAAHWTTLLWSGFLLITVGCLLCLDGIRLIAWLLDRIAGSGIGNVLRPSRSIPLALMVACSLSLYALYEASAVRTVRHIVVTNRIPANTPRVRIVAVSDIHFSALSGVWRLQRVASLVSQAQPDILVSLGDLVDTNMDNRPEEAAMLKSLRPVHGSYAILGNHEAYSGLANSVRFTEKAGFTLLRGSAVESGGIVIAGVDDPMFVEGRNNPETKGLSEKQDAELLRSLEGYRKAGKFILFLRHRPGSHDTIAGLFDLQLSGHTHGGQIWPARYLARRANSDIPQGMSTVQGTLGRSLIYVSNGTGFWGPPMRLFTPPEITVIDLVHPPATSPH